MKKNKLLWLYLMIPVSHCFAQDLYYDAIELASYVKGVGVERGFEMSNAPRWTSILARYSTGLSKKEKVTLKEVTTKFEENPFLRDYLEDLQAESEEEPSIKVSPTAGIASVGGINVTRLALGAAEFLVKRAKEELSVSFFSKFKEDLDNDDFKDLQTLFHHTYNVLQVIDVEVYHYAAYLTTLRAAFKKDLSELLLTLPKIPDNHRDFFDRNPNLEVLFESGLSLVSSLSKGKHPGETLNLLATKDLSVLDLNLHSFLQVGNIFSQSLKSRDPARYWIGVDSLKYLQNDAFRIYLGLIYQKIDSSIVFNNTLVFKDDVLAPVADHLDSYVKYREYMHDFLMRAEKVEGFLQELNGRRLSELTYEDIYKYFDGSFDLLEHTLEIDSLPGMNVDLKSKVGTLVTNTRTFGDLYLDLNQARYTSAVFNLNLLLDSALGQEFTFRKQVIRYGTFMAAVAEAEDPEQVSEAIEAVVLPPGSANIKRATKFNVALNSYVGIAYGCEAIDSYDNRKRMIAVNAPIGIALSWGGVCFDHASSTIFLSAIDLGALTAFRFGDGDAESLPEVHLKNIFAPGISYVFGFPNLPLSIGIGGQFGPSLRKIGDEVTNTKINFRLHGFFAVDIPLLNFYTKPK